MNTIKTINRILWLMMGVYGLAIALFYLLNPLA